MPALLFVLAPHSVKNSFFLQDVSFAVGFGHLLSLFNRTPGPKPCLTPSEEHLPIRSPGSRISRCPLCSRLRPPFSKENFAFCKTSVLLYVLAPFLGKGQNSSRRPLCFGVGHLLNHAYKRYLTRSASLWLSLTVSLSVGGLVIE